MKLVNSDEFVIVDEEVLPLISKLGKLRLDTDGYIRATNHRKYPYRFHRYVAQFYGMDVENKEIHHVNKNKLDNRKINLMNLTPSQHTILEERYLNAYNSDGYKNRKGKPNPSQSIRMKNNNPMSHPEVIVKWIGANNPKYKPLDLNYIKYCKHVLNLTAKETAKMCNFSQGRFSTTLKTRFKVSWIEI